MVPIDGDAYISPSPTSWQCAISIKLFQSKQSQGAQVRGRRKDLTSPWRLSQRMRGQCEPTSVHILATTHSYSYNLQNVLLMRKNSWKKGRQG